MFFNQNADTTGKQLIGQLSFLVNEIQIHSEGHYYYIDQESRENLSRGLDVLLHAKVLSELELTEADKYYVSQVMEFKSNIFDMG